MNPNIHNLGTGVVLLTYGRGYPFSSVPWRNGFWEELAKELLYRQIRNYNRAAGYARADATHVRITLGHGKFIEATTPDVRIGSTEELIGKRVAICVPQQYFNVSNAVEWWESWVGTRYDYTELADFALSGILKLFPKRLGILDRKDRFVCSTFAAGGFNIGGFDFGMDWQSISPAFYENKSQLFRVTYCTVGT